MGTEKFFPLLSVALLGALALACAPESRAVAPSVLIEPLVVQNSEKTLSAEQSSVDLEVQAVQEVQSINAGQFKPYEISTGDQAHFEF